MRPLFTCFLALLLARPALAQYARLYSFAHTAGIATLCNDGDSLLWFGDDRGGVYALRWATGQVCRSNPEAHTAQVSQIAVLPDGRYATAAHDGRVVVWAVNHRPIRRFQNPGIGRYASYRGDEATFVCWNPTADTVFFGGYNGMVCAGDLQTGQIRTIYRDTQAGITSGLLANGQLYAAAGKRLLHLRRGATPAAETVLTASTPVCEAAPGATFGHWFIWGSDGRLQVFEQSRSIWESPSAQGGSAEFCLFSHADTLFALVGSDSAARLWNLRNQQLRQILSGHSHEVKATTATNRGLMLATTDRVGVMQIWKRPTALPPHPQTGLPPAVIVRHRLQVHGSALRIQVWDHQAQDGDTISLFLDGMEVLQHHALTTRKYEMTVTLPPSPAPHQLVLYAHNRGRVGPNTAAIRLSGRGLDETRVLSSDLRTASAIEIQQTE